MLMRSMCVCMHKKKENTTNFTCLPTQLKMKWNGKRKTENYYNNKGQLIDVSLSEHGYGLCVCVCELLYSWMLSIFWDPA